MEGKAGKDKSLNSKLDLVLQLKKLKTDIYFLLST